MKQVLIGHGFLESVGKLAAGDTSRVVDFMQKFMRDPASPGISFERVERVKGEGLWSARITQGLRAIIHQGEDAWRLLFAGQHDDAYRWATTHRLDTSKVTGALQVIETVEEVEKIVEQADVTPDAPPLLPARTHSDDYLLSLGIPGDWLPAIRAVRTEEQLFEVAGRLPAELGEMLLDLSSGKMVTPPGAPRPGISPTDHPDTLRRFFVIQDESDLADLLERPFEAWTRFLHPSQRDLVTRDWNGPVKVTGSAGTGKTVVALHRARHLARQGQKVLVTTYVTTLGKNLGRSLRLLCNDDELSRIDVTTVHSLALRLVREVDPDLQPADSRRIEQLLENAHRYSGVDASLSFIQSEWDNVLEAQGIETWDAYRDAPRTGRGKPLSARARKALWAVFALVRDELAANRQATFSGLCRKAGQFLGAGRLTSPYDAVIVDELQDLRPAEIRLLLALARDPAGLMVVGDAGQRIYSSPFSLKALGIDTRGRSRILRINYRTTEQIRRAADKVLGTATDDMDGEAEDRNALRSLLRGPAPTLRGFRSKCDEVAFVLETVQSLRKQGLAPGEMAVFARTATDLRDVQEALESDGVPVHTLSRDDDVTREQGIHCGSLHRAKGLEFRVVFVIRAAAGRIPLASVMARQEDPVDRETELAKERSLLYVALTRARDEAFVTWTGAPSPFLEPILDEGSNV